MDRGTDSDLSVKHRAHGEGTIFQRKDGRWAAVITLPNGRRKWFYGKTRESVRRRLTNALAEKEKGLLLDTPRQTVEQYLTRWAEEIRPTVRPKTYEVYELDVRRAIPHIGKLTLGNLKPVHVQSCYTALLARGLSHRSVSQVHAVLHRALGDAVKHELIYRNPVDAVKPPRVHRTEMKTLSLPEVQALFAATEGHRMHALWVLLATTGIRLGEAMGLKWGDINVGTGTMVIQRAAQRQKGAGIVFVEPKTSRSRRTVFLPSTTIAALKAHREMQHAERQMADALWEDHDLVFCKPTGQPICPSLATDHLRAALRKANLPKVRVHDLRHTAATLLLQQGVHPKIVQDLLGHSTVTLTLDTYSHVTPALHGEAAARMDELFRNLVPKPTERI